MRFGRGVAGLCRGFADPVAGLRLSAELRWLVFARIRLVEYSMVRWRVGWGVPHAVIFRGPDPITVEDSDRVQYSCRKSDRFLLGPFWRVFIASVQVQCSIERRGSALSEQVPDGEKQVSEALLLTRLPDQFIMEEDRA